MAESYPNGLKTLSEKEKLLVTSSFSFSFSYSVFKRLVSQGRQKVSLCGSGLSLSYTSPGFYVSPYKSFENTVGKGEIARDEQFLLFPQCFSTHLKNFLPFSSYLKIVACNLFEFGRVYNLSFGKWLNDGKNKDFSKHLEKRRM